MIFKLFNRFDDISILEKQPITSDFYQVLAKLKDLAMSQTSTEYQTFVDYASACFWAIRKQEYSFIAESFARLETGQPLSVLDVGCGVVPMCNWISARGHHVVAFDPLREDIEFLVKNDMNKFYGSRVKYLVARSEVLPFADASFDVVTCTSVLEHIIPGNDRISIFEIARVLKPGGHLLITFDVSPAPTEEMGNVEKSGYRGYTLPFTVASATRLLDYLTRAFEVSSHDLPTELNSITWEDVYTFWRAAQRHDERQDPLRHYLAIGNVLERKRSIVLPTSAELFAAYIEGQDSVLHRLSFFEYHASERARLIERLTQDDRSAKANDQSDPRQINPFGRMVKKLRRIFN